MKTEGKLKLYPTLACFGSFVSIQAKKHQPHEALHWNFWVSSCGSRPVFHYKKQGSLLWSPQNPAVLKVYQGTLLLRNAM